MMNDEWPSVMSDITLGHSSFIIHRSSFIISCYHHHNLALHLFRAEMRF